MIERLSSEIQTGPDVQTTISALPAHLQNFAHDGFNRGYFSESDLTDARYVDEQHELKQVAVHEVGHEVMAKEKRWTVSMVSIVPEGRRLGVTVSHSNPTHSFEDMLWGKVAICYGSMAAEQTFGNFDNRGCGSDETQAYFAAKYLSGILAPRVNISAEKIIADQFSTAKSVTSQKKRVIEEKSWNLMWQRVAA